MTLNACHRACSAVERARAQGIAERAHPQGVAERAHPQGAAEPAIAERIAAEPAIADLAPLRAAERLRRPASLSPVPSFVPDGALQ